MSRRASLAPISELPTRPVFFIDDNAHARIETLQCSQDEFVISQRGRRSLPVTWSPDDNLRKQNYHNCPKKAAKPSAVKTGSTLRSAAYKRRLLGPEDCYIKKSKPNTPDASNMMTTRANHKRISFSPEKLELVDISTPLKIKLLTLEKAQVKKPVSKLDFDVLATAESPVSATRKRAHNNDGEPSVSALKRSKS